MLNISLWSEINQLILAFMKNVCCNLSGKTRPEHDLIGDMNVPVEYYFGVQTLRAVENFNISRDHLSDYPEFINAFAEVKQAAALANNDLGMMSDEIAQAIVKACKEISGGKLHDHFVVDMMQGGAGTSTNMNANEVIANRALEIMGHQRGEYQFCSPNDHVNMAQSTNDSYPSSITIGVAHAMKRMCISLRALVASFREKGKEYQDAIKMGRTQLQDAVPMTVGQEFESWAVSLEIELEKIEQSLAEPIEVNMGATAIGTGINSDPDYTPLCVKHLAEITGLNIVAARNFIQATNDTSGLVTNSSMVKRLGIKLSKICSDLRLLTSGPRTGLCEINLPAMQPGSSIMPGKVNPVIPEVVNQVVFKVIGNDMTIAWGAEAAQLELNVMEPVMAYAMFDSINLMANGMDTLRTLCVDGITVNVDRCRQMVLNSIGLVTALNPYIGYVNSTIVAKEALESGKGVYDLVLEKGLLSKAELDDILRPENMVQPRKLAKK